MLCFNTNDPSSSLEGRQGEEGRAGAQDGTKKKMRKTRRCNSGGTMTGTRRSSYNMHGSNMGHVHPQRNDLQQAKDDNDTITLYWSKHIQQTTIQQPPSSALQPVSIDMIFSFSSSPARVQIQFGVLCHNESTNQGWYVTSPYMTQTDLEAHADLVGLDLIDTDFTSVASMVATSFKLYHCNAGGGVTQNPYDMEFTTSSFLVRVTEKHEDEHPSLMRFEIHMYHRNLNARGVFFSWEVPPYQQDGQGHVGGRFMNRFMSIRPNPSEEQGTRLGNKEDDAMLRMKLKQWYDRYQSESESSLRKETELQRGKRDHNEGNEVHTRDDPSSEVGVSSVLHKDATLNVDVPHPKGTGSCAPAQEALSAPEDHQVHEGKSIASTSNGNAADNLVSSAAVVIVQASKRSHSRGGHASNLLLHRSSRNVMARKKNANVR